MPAEGRAGLGWANTVDLRKLPLAEITLLGTHTTADPRAKLDALHLGVFGNLAWVEQRRLDSSPQAFVVLDRGHTVCRSRSCCGAEPAERSHRATCPPTTTISSCLSNNGLLCAGGPCHATHDAP